MIKVITADDHALIRKGILHILSKTPGIQAIDEAENGQQLIDQLQKTKYDIVLLDIAMPGVEIFDLIKKIRFIDPDTAILIVSMLPEKQLGLQLLKAGARGYLNKSTELNDLVSAIKRISSGQRYISDSLADKLAETFSQGRYVSPHDMLSEREFQVLRLIALGKTVSEIADDLFLSVKTISTYRHRLLQKMALKNNAQLTQYAIKNQLV